MGWSVVVTGVSADSAVTCNWRFWAAISTCWERFWWRERTPSAMRRSRGESARLPDAARQPRSRRSAPAFASRRAVLFTCIIFFRAYGCVVCAKTLEIHLLALTHVVFASPSALISPRLSAKSLFSGQTLTTMQIWLANMLRCLQSSRPQNGLLTTPYNQNGEDGQASCRDSSQETPKSILLGEETSRPLAQPGYGGSQQACSPGEHWF